MNETLKIAIMPGKSALYAKHIELVSKSRLADFAGYLMPLWFSSISAEHAAVRESAGLFDCTHMGVLQVSGPGAEAFINYFATNNVSAISPGKSQYSYVLDHSGDILDDIIVSKIESNNYMIVVNAANEEKIKDWIGPLADQLEELRLVLADNNIQLHEISRNYDNLVWPHAQKGFFKLKAQIPNLLTSLHISMV
jgi:glycine cleavage system aminomethyltransferase T